MWLACSGVLRQELRLQRAGQVFEGCWLAEGFGLSAGSGGGAGQSLGFWKDTLVVHACVEVDGVGESELPQQSRQGWERTRQQH